MGPSYKRGREARMTEAEERQFFPENFESCRRCRGYGQITSGLDGDERSTCDDCEGNGLVRKSDH